LLQQALTHRSATDDARDSNERLEFFGDAVLGMVVGEHLWRTFPEWDQGRLSKAKASLVQEAPLADAALSLGVDELVVVGPGERSVGGCRLPSILSDTFEALAGAIYVEQGLDATRSFILDALAGALDALARGEAELTDSKSRLQELCQARWKTTPDYVVVDATGMPHEPSFTVEVEIRGERLGRGMGRSKKEAEQIAADQALAELASRKADG
jgi:ribonuclease-3